MRTPGKRPRVLPAAVAIALLTGAAATAQLRDTAPCTTLLVDTSAENGFSIGAGQASFEACGLADVPASSGPFHCTWGDGYHASRFVASWTALQPLPVAPFEYIFRSDDGGEPGLGFDDVQLFGEIPTSATFPNTTLDVENPQEDPIFAENRRLLRNWRKRPIDSSIWSCGKWSAGSAGRFVAVDRTAQTPTGPCRVRADGSSPWEPCQDQDPLMRALGFGTRIAPIGSFGTHLEVVPPSADVASATWEVFYTGTQLPADPPPGDNTFRFRGEHDVPNAIVAHVHLGYPGQNGPIVYTFPDPTSPIDTSGVLLTDQQILALGANRLYIDVHNAAHPGGAVRGQLIPAQPGIFGNGFEMGDTSGWSFTQP